RMVKQSSHRRVCVYLLCHLEQIQRINDFISILRIQFLGKDVCRELVENRYGNPFRLNSDLLDIVPQRCDVLMPRHKGSHDPTREKNEIYPADLARGKSEILCKQQYC